MALSPEIVNESEIAKSYVVNSELDDDYKKTLLTLLNITTIATNGITPEEKIQKMTEAIHLLTVAQVAFVTKMDERVENAIKNANSRQCGECRAMKFVAREEEKRRRDQAMQEYRLMNGIKEEEHQSKVTINDFKKALITLLLKPYVWVTCCVLAVSPYGVQIVKMMLDHFAK